MVHVRLGARYSIIAEDEDTVVTRTPLPGVGGRECNLSWHELAFDSHEQGPTVGWFGFFAYETGASVKGIHAATQANIALSAAHFGFHDAVAVIDHESGVCTFHAVDWPEGVMDHRPPVEDRLAALRAIIEDGDTRGLDRFPFQASEPRAWVRATSPDDRRPGSTRTGCGIAPNAQESATGSASAQSPRLKPAARGDGFTSSPPVANMSREEYLRKVQRIKRYIAAGDVYQVNLTMRFAVQTTAQPYRLYQRVGEINPASHAAFVQYDDFAIISASPELFLDLRDGRVVTRPIKGTRPRTGDPIQDAVARHELETSEKERAELNMIVDLMRNDLGRVCEYGSVHVTDPGCIEELPTVFHRVATIEGRLAKGKTNLDLLNATFPGGSITGAPKIRAMQIIRELEPTPRGIYCGSIGWIGLDGSMCMNIAIRTMVQVRDTVYVYAGSGIVADSDPEQEYEETLLKASAMFRALGCDPVRA